MDANTVEVSTSFLFWNGFFVGFALVTGFVCLLQYLNKDNIK